MIVARAECRGSAFGYLLNPFRLSFFSGLALELSYDELRRIYRLEKNTSKLVEVDDDFFEKLNAFMKVEKEEYLKSLRDLSSSKARNFSNLKKMVQEIFALREKKLLNRALVSSRTGDLSMRKVSAEEKQAFRELLKIIALHRKSLPEIFDGDTLKISDIAADSDSLFRIMKDVPAFVGTDMKEYGPFSKGEVIPLPQKIAELLLSRKLAAEK